MAGSGDGCCEGGGLPGDALWRQEPRAVTAWRSPALVRIPRAGGPPRVTVHIARPAGEWAAPSVLAAVALVLMLVRRQRRAQQPHPTPGDDDGQRPRGGAAAAPRRGPQLRGPRHPHPAGARRRPGGLP
ncbi:PREDICTED: tumor suppressor ARF-like isoform X1 [Capra hircus]|uniref:tumor suppressor ARF-like isoform X1 n=1 Tax=Capra hircus TaxID=9925 RepID=UPI000846648D|nr:PREDICTED: tumor suppressor ARF-like isoform X1 [Capra hircus]